ncbi:hypothetical protein NP493_423g02027 [Ridgeia piscesae]|uniref:Uncharacterized protein n=1 Tax=Ridgeia piscesae TaxID=27915 RepID=A0AAD9L0K4_RIDPI|nr:hypothetical protein NP493_423g02027 [Ridgeia piscesae]
MSPMRYFINAAINTDDIVVPLNIHHAHGYAKLLSQSCMPSSTDRGSPVNVDDTSDVPVSLFPSSNHSVCNSQKENPEDSDAESVVADDSGITDDDSSSSDTNEKQRKCCCLQKKTNFPFLHLQKTQASILCLLPVGSIPLNMCSDDMQLTDTF